MRKTTYAVAVSLDGYIAGPDGAMDWLCWSDDVNRSIAEIWKGVDSVLIGRKTFGDDRKLPDQGGEQSRRLSQSGATRDIEIDADLRQERQAEQQRHRHQQVEGVAGAGPEMGKLIRPVARAKAERGRIGGEAGDDG